MSVASFSSYACLALLVAGVGWLLWQWLRRTDDDPVRLVLKWLATLAVPAITIWAGFKIHPIAAVVVGAFLAVFLGILWAPNIGGFLAGFLTGDFDGGKEEVEPRPFYSVAQAHRKAGRFADALAEIDRQLARFPGDAGGLLLRGEILALQLRDLAGAGACVEQVVAQAALPAVTRARALFTLADWQLAALMREEARETLARVRAQFPGTALGHEAAQRLAHVAGEAWRDPYREPARLAVTPAEPGLGLREPGYAAALEPERDPHAEAAALHAHLAAHPADAEAREKLARLYAEQLGHLDWAVAELDRLIQTSGAPPRDVARWLHRQADWHVGFAGDEGAARRALEQVAARFPGSALAAQAGTRLATLKLEIRGRQAGRTLGAGTAEADHAAAA